MGASYAVAPPAAAACVELLLAGLWTFSLPISCAGTVVKTLMLMMVMTMTTCFYYYNVTTAIYK